MSMNKAHMKSIADDLEKIADRLDKIKESEEEKENPNDEDLETVESAHSDLEAIIDTLRDQFDR